MALTLVPALHLMRSSMSIGREIEIRESLTTLCASKLEEHMAQAISDWQIGSYSGDFAAEGHPNLRYLVERSDSAGSGGITDQLMALNASVWEDTNGNLSPDAGELTVMFSGKVAKLGSY